MSGIPSNVSRLEPYFQRLIAQDITLKEDEVKLYNRSLKDVLLDTMQNEMKRIDETFRELYRQPHYVGSYYENTKVGRPDEFDINLELQLPISESHIQIETHGTERGFAKIRVGTQYHPRISAAVERRIESWLENRYLCRNKVIQWLQGIVAKVLTAVQWPSDMTVRLNISGPAVTLNVRVNAKEFSVDLVPVFTFGRNRWPPQPLRQVNNLPRQIETSSLKWCIVPKSPRQDTTSVLQWRMSFYMYEKELMNDLNNMKPVIKLIKLLRDKQNWVGLSSYYIKTIFMWEQEINSHVSGFWRKGISYLFVHMLGRLEHYMELERIPFFWDKQNNLISHLNPAEIQNMFGRVTRLKRQLEVALSTPGQDLSAVVDILFTPPAIRRGRQPIPESGSFGPMGQQPSPNSENLIQAALPNWTGVVGALAVGLGALILMRNQNND